MKILIDQNISFKVKYILREYFPECYHVSDFGLEDKEDMEIWKFAVKNNFNILTYDTDFYDISLVFGHPPKIIWIRLSNLSTKELSKLLLDNIENLTIFLNKGDSDFKSCMEIF